MAKLEEIPNNPQNLGLGQNSVPNSQTQNHSDNQEPNLMNILVGTLVPLIPVILAKMTGQKLPANTVSNEPNALQQLTPVLQTMMNTQNLLLQEIAFLKKNDQIFANNFQNLKLTHKTEQKQIEFNPHQNYENEN